MRRQKHERYHSEATMRLLKQAALPTQTENAAPLDEPTRRGILKAFMGASAALTVGLAGCERKPKRKIVSRLDAAEYQKPGRVSFYSSTWTDGPFPYGMMVKTVDGRPIKIEGNPDHPVNRGTSSAEMQASVLSLYDPDRLRSPQKGGQAISWAAADREVIEALRKAASVLLVTRSTLGPSERALAKSLLVFFKQGVHVVYETVHDGPRRSAWSKLYGRDIEIIPLLDKARVILSLDCDFLGTDGVVLENTLRFAQGRGLDEKNHRAAELPRLYAFEGAMTVTGSNADHRLRLRPSAMRSLVQSLREALAGNEGACAGFASRHGLDVELLRGLVADLRAHPGSAVVLAGGHLPEPVHAAVALLNDDLQAAGTTLLWNAVPATLAVTSCQETAAAFEKGADVVICMGVNPVYDCSGLEFAETLKRARLSVGHDLHLSETLAACSLALPSSHNLESWNDAGCRGASEGLCQPVIAPLFDTRQSAESLLRWTQALAPESDPIRTVTDWYAYMRQRWHRPPERVWEDQLRAGGWFNEGRIEPFPALNRDRAEELIQTEANEGGFELVILPHHAIYDGRFANNGWLQELPHPVSKVVWDNSAAISPATAEQVGASEGDMVNITVGGKSLEIPVLVQRGMADGVVAVELGYGRLAGGQIAGRAGGVNVSPLLGGENPDVPRLVIKAQVTRTGGRHALVRVQKHFSMEGRPIVLEGTLDDFRHDAHFIKHEHHRPRMVNMNPGVDYSKGHKWVMAIDLNRCTGCGACVVACQAENNVAIVGKEQCGLGRRMHWIRIDRYEDGDRDDPSIRQQPMLCQHCDNAPCETVCPVNATSHSPDGLNEMTYNRCVGTRYCSNNCPYKVRRFNYLRYHEPLLRDPVQELAFNPQVTVRSVGVMEKCTFCVQRINEARFHARNRGEAVPDGLVKPACEQVCPARAIVFGDVNDPHSRVARLRESARVFTVLEELNTGPNVLYLARVRNPNTAARAAARRREHL